MKIFHGDCFELLKDIEDNSIDCVITDPPYFIDSMDNNWSTEEQEKRKSNSFISKLPIGMKFDSKQGQNLEKFINQVSKELFRVLKPGGFFLCFSATRMYHNIASGIEKAGFQIRDQISWTFNVSQVKAFRQDHIISKDKIMNDIEKKELKDKLKDHRTPQLKPKFEPICVAMKPIEGRFIDNIRKYQTGLIYIDPDKPFPCNVMYHSKPSKKEREDNTHPTVKPIGIIKELIDIFCPKDGTILDPFLGSGTTAVSARQMKRDFIGSELNKEYIDIINKRISKV